MQFSLENYQNILNNFAPKWKFKQTSTVIELSNRLHTLVEVADAEDITNQKYPTLDLSLEFIFVALKMES